MNTEPKKGIETTDAARKAYTKRTIAAGIASVALVAALGIGAAYAHGGLNRKPNPPAGESAAVQAKEGTQEKIELTAQEVADTTADLHFAGDDVSASSNIAVSIKDGHVMVTETSEDTAANNVWYAPRRAAAMATRLKDTTIKADSEEKATAIKDVTWVTTDTSGSVQIAVVDTPDSSAARTSGEQSPLPKDPETKQADNTETQPAPTQQNEEEKQPEETQENKSSESESKPQEETSSTSREKPKTSDVLNGSDGYTMSKETHDALPEEEKDKVSETAGKTVTDPEGNEIKPAEPAPKPEEEIKPQEPTKQAEDTSSPSTPSNGGSSSSSGNSGSGSSSSSTPREKRPVYRTETRYVVDQAAWSEQVYDHSEIIFSDGTIFYDNASAWQYMKKTGLSYSTKDVYKTVYHEEQGHTEEYQVLDHWE